MPTLDNITIRGFKSIKAIEQLKLNPINVLIGANGSGKSNFLEAFSLVRDVVDGRLRQFVARAGGAERVLHFGSRITEDINVVIAFDDGNWYRLTLEPMYFDDRLALVEQACSKWPTSLPGLNSDDTPALIRDFINVDPWVSYHFHDTSRASPMKNTADLHDNRFLRPDGSNLAAFLYLLRSKHSFSYKQITRTVRLVAPFFDDFNLEPQALNEDTILLEWRHKGSDAYFNAASLSDGTLRFIALATLLLQPDSLRPSVILLDEPELGLHPYAVTMLAALVKKAAVYGQVIMATQSPTLLDHFEPEDVIVANRVNGEASFERLDAERLAVWLEDYSLGQLWEQNELGGRPSPEYRSDRLSTP
ncbi:MAG: AAA family ATPase [Chloroflexota bacterium]|nr:AAA family ATPase [Chloroflexota bacterium]MDE2959289.1 AAA family ATPase [Chloroflexota bacterium]